jgi:DnaJ-class molecular chaperone
MSSKLVKCTDCDGKGRVVSQMYHLASSKICESCNGVGRRKPVSDKGGSRK